ALHHHQHSPSLTSCLDVSSTLQRTTVFFSVTVPPTPHIYTLSLHDALPICWERRSAAKPRPTPHLAGRTQWVRRQCVPARALSRSEEHTSELQSHLNLVCRLLLEKKNKTRKKNKIISITTIEAIDEDMQQQR